MTAAAAHRAVALRAGAERLSPTALVLVVLAHAAALFALQSRGSFTGPEPPAALMVELLANEMLAPKPPVVVPPKPPSPASRPAPPTRVLPRPDAPVLASQSAPTPAAYEIAKADKPVAVAAPAPAAPSPTPATTPVAPAAPTPAAAAPVTAPRFDASYLDNPAPAYPPLSKRAGEEGRVVLHVFVEPSGLPGKVELRSSSGFERLDRSAATAVARWKFVPARQGSEAVGAWVLVPIVFGLKG